MTLATKAATEDRYSDISCHHAMTATNTVIYSAAIMRPTVGRSLL